MYTPAETRAYESALSLVARAAMRSRQPLTGPLCVTVTASFPVPASWSQRQRTAAYAGTVLPTKKPDPDNILKIIDALNTIVWGDDSQIVDARVVKVYAVEPSLRIEVRQEKDRSRLRLTARRRMGNPTPSRAASFGWPLRI
jgi:Holliday junction resolvase RusA-like endonuclease